MKTVIAMVAKRMLHWRLRVASHRRCRHCGGMEPEDSTSTPRVTLPKNLPATLQGLDDVELETLQREVAAEIKRRRADVRTKAGPAGVGQASLRVAIDQPSPAAKGEIPAGKANLIRASHQTGMKPAAIARVLRVSVAVVNRVLGTNGKSKA